jgi:hypothetical protein
MKFYSDMAIGLSRIFGFRLKENFCQPYTAINFTDFWRRWHNDSLFEASAVRTNTRKAGLRIACPKEIAYLQGFITHDEFVKLAKRFEKSLKTIAV